MPYVPSMTALFRLFLNVLLVCRLQWSWFVLLLCMPLRPSVQVKKRHCEVEVTVGSFAWLSTEHLQLAPGLAQKLAAKWAGPYRVVVSVGPVAFHLELPPAWKIHDVFHALQLCPAFRFDGTVSAH